MSTEDDFKRRMSLLSVAEARQQLLNWVDSCAFVGNSDGVEFYVDVLIAAVRKERKEGQAGQ